LKKLSQDQVELAVRTLAETALENEAYFSDLDGVMGDGDFGASLAGGCHAILNGWDGLNRGDIGAFLLNVAMIWTGSVGGCSGTVWGTLFMRCGMAFRGKTEIGFDEVIPALKNSMEGIMQRGGASLGDKTMLDALNALVESLEKSVAAGAEWNATLDDAAEAAVAMKESTKDWTAKRGRQFFTGDRSIGTYDPGIVAVGVFATAIAKALKE